MVRYVPASSSISGIDFVLVFAYGVHVHVHSQNQVSSNPSQSIPLLAPITRYVPKSPTDSNLIVQLQPRANIHPMQTRSKSKPHHALTTTISDDYLCTITEPSTIHETVQHSCWATAVK